MRRVSDSWTISGYEPYKILRFILRLTLIGLILTTLFSLFSIRSFRFLTSLSFFSTHVQVYAEMISTVVLPVVAGFTMWLQSDESASGKEAAIDFLLCILWFFFFWSIAIYGLLSYSVV